MTCECSKNIEIKIKKLRSDVIIPEQASSGSVGFDLRVVLPFDKEENEQISKIRINPNESVRLSTELIFELPDGYFMQINPRSSMGIKKGLVLQNTIGILDSDYRGICYLFVKNTSSDVIEIQHQERLAQAIILPYPKIKFIEVEELSKTDRGEGGMGSSGRI